MAHRPRFPPNPIRMRPMNRVEQAQHLRYVRNKVHLADPPRRPQRVGREISLEKRKPRWFRENRNMFNYRWRKYHNANAANDLFGRRDRFNPNYVHRFVPEHASPNYADAYSIDKRRAKIDNQRMNDYHAAVIDRARLVAQNRRNNARMQRAIELSQMEQFGPTY